MFECHGQWTSIWIIRFYFLLIIGFLPVSTALAEAAGEVVSTLGAVEVLREGRWQPVGPGATLNAGEIVRTGVGSRAAVLLASGTQIKLNARSQLELKQIAPPPEKGFISTAIQALQSILRVLNGEVWVRNSGEPLEVQTVAATATIRGTEFNLAVGFDDTARLTVVNGLVEFSNPQGSVLVAANEQADAKLREAPRKTVLLNPLDAVQWSLYYPRLIGGAADNHWLQAAQQHLLRGEVAAARQAIDRALALNRNDALAYSLRSTVELTQNRKAEARADAEKAVTVNPSSSTAYLSLSWVQQAEFDLDGALASVRKAVELDPHNVQALIQKSGLLFGMGRLQDAVKIAEQAWQVAPDDAMVNTIWGFLQLARNRVNEAREAFEAAIAQDSTLGLPHLGLGLALFRVNETDGAVAEMRKATLLEPQVALYNSYLGKAFYEIKDDRRAKKYLELAKQLDPRDPTPWLYDAIRLQSVNRPVEAIENLQKSIELNDDRGVYRSRLLLDEDLAARSATLGRIYNEVGFTQLALQEGWRSVSRDPTNYSAHRLLADSYAALPGVEPARISELLQAQLLQPINITPVSPQRAETKLLLPAAGPLTPSLYEFNPLFVREKPSLYFSGVGGNQEAWGDELIVSGLTDRFSYSLGQFHYQSNGYRPNNDLENNIYTLFFQAAVTPDFSLQAEYRSRETLAGDMALSFDDSFNASKRRDFDQETARLGARYALSPQTQVIASVIYADVRDALTFPDFNITAGINDKGYLAETQLIHKTDRFNVVTGIGSYSADQGYFGFQQPSTTSEQQTAYSYVNLAFSDDFIWTVGSSYESYKGSSAHLNELNPKLGLQWAINDHISLRAAAFQVVTRAFSIDQTIEPTQVAGFNQLNDFPDATISKNYGVGLNVRFDNQWFGGLEALRRDNEIPFGTLDVPEFYEIEHNQQYFYSAYLYWLPSPRWAVATSWLYEKFEDECFRCQLFNSIPIQMKTFSLPVKIQYFAPSGFFAGLGMTYVNQHVQFLDLQSSTAAPIQSDHFFLVDAGFGYRLPKRRGIIALEARNLFDKQFHFQDYSFITADQTANPRFIPERTLFGRLILNF